MLKISRMDIDDVGGNPAKLAAVIVRQIPDLKPPVPVREIAEALGIYEIREETLPNLEGGLITPDDKSGGAILVNVDRPETRKRYTIGHELGHYLNPWHKPPGPQGFRCSSRDMAVEAFKPGDRAVQMEVQANEFAAELLMPSGLVMTFLRGLFGLEISHILSMADKFTVSREASARRYIDSRSEPGAIVFSKDGVIRYVKKHPRFPTLCVWNRDPLPPDSASKKTSLEIGGVSDWFTLEADVWLKYPKRNRVCEQTLAQQNGFRIILLALEDAEDEDKDEDEDVEWAPPTFHR